MAERTPTSKSIKSNRHHKSRVNKASKNETTHETLQTALDWHPETLNAVQGSSSTREPAFFDMHMDERLILKNLVHLPSMTTTFRDIVDEKLRTSAGNPVPLPPAKGFYTVDKVLDLEAEIAPQAWKEIDVQNRYLRVTSVFLLRIASTLAFKLTDWGQHFFSWNVANEHMPKNAIGDGFFQIKPDASPELDDPATFQTLGQIAHWFPNVAIWEFKNLFAGSQLRLEDLLTLAQEDEPFPWIQCPGSAKCSRHYDAKTGKVSIQGAPMGFDAASPVCAIPADPDFQDTSSATNIVGGKRKTKAFAYNFEDSKKHSTWAEAVRQDLTFIILQCGNFEVVLHRCRVTGTFYISDVIAVDRPGYGKHQVGLYLAIYHDVFDRTEQLSRAYLTNKVPNSWLRCYDTKSTRGKGVGPMKRESWEELMALQKDVERRAREYDLAIVRTKKNSYLIPGQSSPFKRLHSSRAQDTNEPGSSFGLTSEDFSLDPGNTKIPHLFIDIDAQNEINPLIFSARLHTGTIKWDRRLVVKLGHNDADYLKILDEFHAYCRLLPLEKIRPFIPDLLGCFHYISPSDAELRHIILVMSDSGTPLAKLKVGVTLKDRMACFRLLQNLHLAGYLHGSLSERKILRNKSDNDIRFVGFSGTVMPRSAPEKRGEFDRLAEILNGIAEEHFQRLKNETGKRRRHSQANHTRAILMGPVVNRNSPDLRSNLDHLIEWVRYHQPELLTQDLNAQIVDDFLHITGLTREDADLFMEMWITSFPYGLDETPVHAFPTQ